MSDFEPSTVVISSHTRDLIDDLRTVDERPRTRVVRDAVVLLHTVAHLEHRGFQLAIEEGSPVVVTNWYRETMREAVRKARLRVGEEAECLRRFPDEHGAELLRAALAGTLTRDATVADRRFHGEGYQ